ncbi:glycosyltransferase family 9 protein, partial [Bdellovibrionota bacterium FG-2]
WGWLQLCRALNRAQYDEVFDLHQSLRSRVAQSYLKLGAMIGGRPLAWRSISKQRLAYWGFFSFKKIWPKSLRPDGFVSRAARFVGGTGEERPDLSFLLAVGEPASVLQGSIIEVPNPSQRPQQEDVKERLKRDGYYCVMPGAKGVGKTWGTQKFLGVIQKVDAVAVVLGAKREPESLVLSAVLRERGIAHIAGIGCWSLPQIAQILANSRGYLGNDTGLGHLAEAVGLDVNVIFGPTHPGLGFAPWRTKSVFVESSLWCRPCGKDGRNCFRPLRRFQCLNDVSVDQVLREFILRPPVEFK